MADLIISQPMTFTVDVKNGLVERPQRESLMRGDKMANRIIAELVYGSEPFDITGVTVKGKFCRPPSGDEIDLAGEAKGNVAEVQLTDQCYTSGGHYEARVILVLGGVERTVLFISGDVLKSGSGNAAGDEETGGSGGSTGSGLPAGGTAGQVLVKVSSAQGDAIWKNLTAADVGARPDNWMPTAADVGALPSDGTAVNANALNGKSADEYALKTDIPNTSNPLDAYPVGSIYMSVNETSPASLFGGTWEQLKDRFLLGAGDVYEAGSTGGEAAHALTLSEMPEHTHDVKGLWRSPNSGDYDCTAYARLEDASAINRNGSTPIMESGSGAAHNNMPPYVTVYIWKRVS